MLAVTYENDGALSSGDCRQCTSALGVAVHFRNDDRSDVDSFSEGLRLHIALLSDRTIHNENYVVWFDCFLNLFHFIEQLRFLSVPSRSINQNNFHSLIPELCDSLLSDGNWICLDVAAIEWYANFGCILLELIKSACTESVCANHRHSPSFLLVVVGHLAACCCFAASLETDEHDDVGLPSFGLKRFLIDFQKPS